MSLAKKPSYSKGLAGVIAGETSIATVGKKGHGLMYRGYALEDLTQNCEFEEVAFLLTRGRLPSAKELRAYKKRVNTRFALPGAVRRLLELTPKGAHPMDILKSVCALLGSLDPEDIDQMSAERVQDIADTLLASFPSAIAYHYRFHFFGEVIDTKAKSGDSIARHFVRSLHQKEPNEDIVRCVDVSLICYAEHGFAASSFACRVTTSTLSDAYSAICSAIGTLRGPLHGGANEKAFELISRFSSADQARTAILDMLRRKVKIMGFGHRVYRTNDPRSAVMHRWAERLATGPFGRPDLMAVANTIQTTLWDEKKLFPNVDFPAAMAYHQCGIPTNLFTPLFVCARTAGWMAHVIEQRAANRLIRPTALYVGPQLQKFPKIQSRL